MRFHLLRAFLTIAEAGSFTNAAERLGMSQSSLSHAIAELERELGAPVLNRGRQGAELTNLGQRILPHANIVMTHLEKINDEAIENTAVRGRLRLGAIPSANVGFIPGAIARFARRFPQVEVSLFEEPSQDPDRIVQWVRDSTIDLAIVELPFPKLETRPLLYDELCGVVSSSSPLSQRNHVSLSDLACRPFVMSRYTSEKLVRKAYASASADVPIRFDVQDLGTLANIVREDLAVSILPRLAMPTCPPGVTLLSLSPRLRRRIGFAATSFEKLPPAAAAFAAFAEESSSLR